MHLHFFREALFRPRSIGAIVPSSKVLARRMAEQLNLAHANCVVEYGPGTGVLTQELIARKPAHTQLVVIEANTRFAQHLHTRYAHRDDVHIVHDSAENLGQALLERGLPLADSIVSGLPFASLPAKVTDGILEATHQHLRPGGRFVLFQYSRIRTGRFEQYFKQIGSERILWNLPPAFVMTYEHLRTPKA